MLDKLSLKKLLLVRSEILGLFLNTLTANNKYCRCNRENFRNKVKRNYLKNQKLVLKFSWCF